MQFEVIHVNLLSSTDFNFLPSLPNSGYSNETPFGREQRVVHYYSLLFHEITKICFSFSFFPSETGLKNFYCSFHASHFFFFKFTYLFRERMCTWAGKEQIERERESQAGTMLSAQSPTWGSNPQTKRSWPEPKPRVRGWTNWDTEVPLATFI